MKVLIAEDDRVSMLVLRKALERLDCEVIAAADGGTAWTVLRTEDVPLVISDWMMPAVDGLSLCRRLRERPERPYVYFVLLTARGAREDRLAALEAGVDDFLVKPLDQGELAARLVVARRILAMQGALRQQSNDLHDHSRELERMRDELAEQNQALERTMEFLTLANHRFMHLFQCVPAACYSCDGAGRVHAWNDASAKLFGLAQHEALTRPIWEVLCETEAAAQEANERRHREVIALALAGESTVGLETEVADRRGRRIHVLSSTFPLAAVGDSATGVICANLDISDRVRLERRLSALAVTDGLTGLRNHRCFRETLDSAFGEARSERHDLALVMVDVDHFKQYNDAFGHPAGDVVLRAIAEILAAGVAQPATVARYGGEEFAVLLPGCGAAEASGAAERLRRAVESYPWPRRPVTASLGVAAAPPFAGGPAALLERADRVLYQAKANGRNCVVVADRVAVGAERRSMASAA
ncbi:MAG: diguanylate cyclase [Chthonomonadales bacterium]|nr:diguanylate cyclase [Chthonomonadales bacterium]